MVRRLVQLLVAIQFSGVRSFSATAATGRSIAEWCVSSDRSEATVAVSSASTVVGAMRDFWHVAHTFGGEGGAPGRQRLLAFPAWRDAADPAAFQRVLEHIQSCADICEFMGDTMLIAGKHPSAPPSESEPHAAPVPMILLRSFMQKPWNDFSEENFGEADPFAALPDGDYINDNELVDPEALSDDECMAKMVGWVKAVAEDIGVLPRESADAPLLDPHLAGVSCALSRARTGEEIYEAFWGAALELASAEEHAHATTVLTTPNFARFNANAFERLASTLNDALAELDLGKHVQLVCVHPAYTTVDEDRSRRLEFALGTAPLPIISLLRTSLVERTRNGSRVGSAYTQGLIEVHERLCGPAGGLIY